MQSTACSSSTKINDDVMRTVALDYFTGHSRVNESNLKLIRFWFRGGRYTTYEIMTAAQFYSRYISSNSFSFGYDCKNINESRRSPKMLYNCTWLHHELCKNLFPTVKIQTFFGIYLHAVYLHAIVVHAIAV